MLATTTHDTKRSEDARARINVLSEVPEEWQGAVSRWRRVNAANRSRVAGGQAPDANDEYLFYQALVGAWPAEGLGGQTPRQAPSDLVPRIGAYMHKAIKEAKLHTSWITPNAAYEAAVARFVERTLSGRTAPAFLGSFVAFLKRIATAGMTNALAQLVLKIASPGVPDFYQGTELWDLSLVDPDNRRPVDWATRRRMLETLDPWLARAASGAGTRDDDPVLAAEVGRMLESWPDGRVKAFVTASGLRLRRACPALFLEGSYVPLTVTGVHAEHVVAFARLADQDALVAIVPRLTTRVPRGRDGLPVGVAAWVDTVVQLPAGLAGRAFRDVLTGMRRAPSGGGDALPLGRVLDDCPVALLWGGPGASSAGRASKA
jgi:(1->4)-alpha-D-glucan 1-alpha-D-glucosylmutase